MSSSQALAQDENQVTLDEALALARGHHQQGNYLLAERTYRDVLRAVPDHFPTTQFLGVLLFQLGSYHDALHFFKLAVDTEPDDTQCLNNYGGVLTHLGQYDEALACYDKVLAVEPDNTDTLNNKSYALWLMGDYKGAEALSRRALDVEPENVTALNGLGMVLAKLVKYEEALDFWERAHELNPEEPMYLTNLGNALREMGRLPQAKERCEQALALDAENSEAMNNLANVRRDQGALDEAIELYARATNIKPDSAEAHMNKGIALIDSHRYEEAAVAARYAVAFDEALAGAYSVLCKSLLELGDMEKAHAAAQRGIHLDPDSATAYLDLAEVLSAMDQYDDATAALEQALKNEPDNARAFIDLCDVRENLGDFEGAMEALDRGEKISPDMPKISLRRATLCLHNNRAEEGLGHIDKALAAAPKWPALYQVKADMMVTLNRNEEAEEAARKAIDLNDQLIGSYSILVSLKKIKTPDDPLFQKMVALAPKSDFGDRSDVPYYYMMSDAYELFEDYDQAFESLKKANDIRARTNYYEPKGKAGMAKGIKRIYTADYIKEVSEGGYESSVPVFIVGMPRSGTTLTEQIISSHPDVYGAGELPLIADIHQAVRMNPDGHDLSTYGKEYVDAVLAMDKDDMPKRVTDKMPANYYSVGFIKCILPNAKIIHCRRNPMDTCLSNYKQNFARGQYWSYDMESLGNQYLEYLNVMEHWASVMDPADYLEIDYEETVGDPEGQARKLIDFVGLEWDDACLSPHKNKRAVLTASRAQVSQPVYKTSVEKWRRYEKHLQPLVKIVMPDEALSDEELAEN